MATDRIQVRKAFADLRNQGFIALMTHKCCSSCAGADISQRPDFTEDETPVVYFHQQDAEAFSGETLTRELHLRHDLPTEQHAIKVVTVLGKHGLTTDWDGNRSRTIAITRYDR